MIICCARSASVDQQLMRYQSVCSWVFGFPGDPVDGDAELAHRPAVWGHPELGVASNVADDDDLAY